MPLSDSRSRLISEIYEVVLKPERYDNFMSLWGEHISAVVRGLEENSNDPLAQTLNMNDPELEIHFTRVHDILEKLGREASEYIHAENYCRERQGPTFFINRDGAISAKNERANNLLKGAKCSGDIRYYFTRSDYAILQEMLVGIDSPGFLEKLRVVHMEIPVSAGIDTKENLFVIRPLVTGANNEISLCISQTKMEWSSEFSQVLENTFSLTRSEVEVVSGLCEGMSLAKLAQNRSRSVHTIRAQVKSLIQKTGTNSQANLVRIILTLASLGVGDNQRGRGDLNLLEAAVEVEIEVGNGLMIPVHFYGPDNGRPVIIIHGMLNGTFINKRMGRLLREKNIRLIAPVRPGFGICPPTYNIETAPEEFAADLALIMESLQISRAPIIGHMAGSIYAFSAAASLGEKVTALISISGGAPITSIKQFSDMAKRQKIVAMTARFTPSLLPTIIRSGISQIDKGDDKSFMNALFSQGTHDRKIAERADIKAIILSGYRFAIAQGHKGFEIDSRHVTRNWSAYIDQIQQPVTIIHGTLDPLVSIGSIRKLVRENPSYELIEFKTSGQLVFYQNTRAVLDIVSKILDEHPE